MAPEPSTTVDIDLSAYSVRKTWSLPPLLAVPIIFGWLVLIGLLLMVSVPLAVILGLVSLVGIILNFAITTRRRLSSSTTGQKSEFIAVEQLAQRPPSFDHTFDEILQTVNSHRRSPDGTVEHAVGMSKRTHAIIYIILGIVILLVGLPLVILMRLGGALLGPAIVLIIAAMYAMFTRARRVLQPSADLARQGDTRPPVLFLRSFQDDKIKLQERVRVAGIPTNQSIRMEEALALRLGDFGPFVAIGEPGEGLPQLGAARAYLSDDAWQAAVLQWIKESRLIAMLCGPTHWIHWEMQNIIRFQRLDRVLLLLPPGRKPGSAQARRRQERWNNIVRSLAETPYAAALQQLQIDDILLIQFRPDGQLRIFRSSSDLVQDYELALTLAAYTTFTQPDAEAQLPDSAPSAPMALPGSTATPTAPTSPQSDRLAAKLSMFGLVGGIIASLLAAGPGLDRWILVSLRSLLFAAAVTLGAAVFYNKQARFLGWLFGCVAVGFFVAANAGFFVGSDLIPRNALRIGFVSTSFLATWLLIPLCLSALLAWRFRNFRHLRVWIALLAAGLVIGLLMPLGLYGRESMALTALRFTLVPWSVLAGCIGYGLSLNKRPW